MQARDLMSRPVVTVSAETTLPEAISLLVQHGFAALPVVDDVGRVIGILSESDALTAGPGQADTLVETAMTAPVHVLAPQTEVSAIAVRMLNHNLRSMPIVEAGLLVGIVSRRDVLRVLIDDDATIESRIRALLDDYAGSRRAWAIEVREGRVEITGGFADTQETRVVAALARTVSGVRHVETYPTGVTSVRRGT